LTSTMNFVNPHRKKMSAFCLINYHWCIFLISNSCVALSASSADVRAYLFLHGGSILLTADNSSFPFASYFNNNNSTLAGEAIITTIFYPTFLVCDGIDLNLTLSQSSIKSNGYGVRIDLSEAEYITIVDAIDASSGPFLPAVLFVPDGAYPITVKCMCTFINLSYNLPS
jgi:hypothetical protein